jgi:hypothetical protein
MLWKRHRGVPRHSAAPDAEKPRFRHNWTVIPLKLGLQAF